MRTPPSSPPSPAESTPSLARAFAESPISTILSTGFGSGLSPFAPGTAGSAVALALAWGSVAYLHPGHGASIAASVGLLASGLLTFALGVPVTTRTSRAMGVKDPGVIVLDEFAGQFLASAAVPLFGYGSAGRAAIAWIGSFLAFRIFDVWKPGPIRRIQDLPDGLGIMIDDVLAGLLAAVVTVLLAGSLGP